MKTAVVGSGYFGLVAAACLGDMGGEIISVDHGANKTVMLEQGDVPVHERYLPELLAAGQDFQLLGFRANCFSTSLADSPGAVRQRSHA